MPDPLLEVRNLRAGYGDFQALFGVSFSLQPGQILALIGANGAGKSTLLKAITGLVPAERDAVRATRASQSGAAAPTALLQWALPWCPRAAASSAP